MKPSAITKTNETSVHEGEHFGWGKHQNNAPRNERKTETSCHPFLVQEMIFLIPSIFALNLLTSCSAASCDFGVSD